MGLVLSICIGSAIQMALVVAPVLVLVSWVIGRPMTLVFDNPLDLFAIAGTASSSTPSRPMGKRRGSRACCSSGFMGCSAWHSSLSDNAAPCVRPPRREQACSTQLLNWRAGL
jgi:hypothetical protein